jgi:hypothetical protein
VALGHRECQVFTRLNDERVSRMRRFSFERAPSATGSRFKTLLMAAHNSGLADFGSAGTLAAGPCTLTSEVASGATSSAASGVESAIRSPPGSPPPLNY